MTKNLNDYIKKSHLKAVEKFNEELKAWAKETEEDAAVLYEDANTSFTLSNLRVENGRLNYLYDGREKGERVVICYGRGKYYENEIDGIMDAIKFWRGCLRRAKKYWAMDPDKLDRIQDGEEDDIEDEEND